MAVSLPEPRAQIATRSAPKQNWFLYAYLFLLPLQNVQTGYMPKLAAGLNFLNIGFCFALAGAWGCGGRVAAGALQRWILAYVAYACLSLYIGYQHVGGDTDEHLSVLKDAMLAVMLVFVAQMSVTDWKTLRRLIFVMLLPLPYMLRVTWDQHASVSSWHYKDALRISGTFSELGANEFAAFCVMMSILIFTLLLAGAMSWRWRALLVGAIACMLLGVVWTYSRTAYIALLVGLAVVMLLWRGRWKLAVPLFIAALIAPNLMPVSVVERFNSTTLEEGKRDESTENRFEFWRIAWDNFEKYPMLGSGYHTFHHAEINPHQTDTHNFFMRELTEKGVVGAGITFGMLLSILAACWRTMRRAPTGLAHALGLGMVGAWLALMIENFFGDRFTYYPLIGYFWVFLGLTLKARELHESEQARAEVPAAPAPPRPQYAVPLSARGG